MTTLLLNSFLALLVIFFAVMAYYPLFLKTSETESSPEVYKEDVVVSVAPAPIAQNAPRVIGRTGRYSTRDDNDPNHPGNRPAA